MTRFFLVIINLFLISCIYSQDTHVIKLTKEQIEDLFIQNNLELIAGKLNIDIADAAITQAKLLNNPSLGIGDINFWNSDAANELGNSPSGPFGQNIQFSIELEQMIRLAGKRRKMVNLEKVSKEIVIQEFESLLLNLKTELRKNLNEIIFLQQYQLIIETQQESIEKLISSYRTQAEKGNIAKTELLRLQSSIIELEAENNEIKIELNNYYKDLKVLLNFPVSDELEIIDSEFNPKNPEEISLLDLIERAKNSRPEFVLSDLYIKYGENLIAYEKSERVPNLSLSANYDRYGGVWKNFAGIGLNIDIPLFNRNQGNVKAAKLNLDQASYNAEYQKNLIQQEIIQSYNNYRINYDFYRKIVDNDFSGDMENMLDIYSRNLINRNISMVEYIDFIDAYKANMQTILNAKKNMNISFAELQFSVNNEIK